VPPPSHHPLLKEGERPYQIVFLGSGLSLILFFTAPMIAHSPPIPASSQMEAATSIYWKCSLGLKVKLFFSFRYALLLFFLPTYIYILPHNHLTIVRVLYDLYGSYGDGNFLSYTKVQGNQFVNHFQIRGCCPLDTLIECPPVSDTRSLA
jgi:hypothetical protein